MEGTNVPGIESTPQISTNVPGVQFPFRQEFTREGQSIENTGREISDAAVKGAGIYDEIQRQHDISTSSEAAVKASVRHSQMVEQIGMSSPDGFVRDPQTNEIIQNRDGSQKTIAQQYWESADSDYQQAQQDMTPRAAAMFRSKMEETIAQNTQRLQGKGLSLQAQSSEQRVSNIKDEFSRDFDRAPLPDTGAYYAGPTTEDGSVKQYPSAQKVYDAIQSTQLVRQQMGPVQGKPGFYGPTEVAALKQSDANELGNNWLTSMKQDLMESSGSRAALHNTMKDASSTAVMQIHSLLDVLDGNDPESQRRAQQNLPTLNNSMTPESIHKWKSDLLSMIPAAKQVDKSEYELQKGQLAELAKGARDPDQFFASPLFHKTLIAGGGLGLSSSERIKDLMPIVSQAVTSAALSSVGGIASPESKRIAVNKILDDASKRWPQLAQMMGESNTEGFGEAIRTEAQNQAAAKLQEDERQMREDPMKYAAGIQEGPQGPNGSPKYRSGMAHAIDTRLQGDPSLFAIFKPMSNGKSIFENARSTANNVYARMFGAGANVAALSKQQFEEQAQRITQSKDPRQVTTYFQQLEGQKIPEAEKENFIQHLVHDGKLPQTYVDALNLKTPAERESRWATLMSGAPAMPGDTTDKLLSTEFFSRNASLVNFQNLKYGPNSPTARTAITQYQKSWTDDVKQAMNRGMNESAAYDYADGMRDKTTGAIGVVGAQHDFLGLHFGHSGPQVPVEYGSNDYNDAQKQKINDTLLYAQSPENLAKFKFVPAPGSLPANPNAPSDAANVAGKLSMWQRVAGGWQLMYHTTDKENRSTGNSVPVQVYGPDGKSKHSIFVPESAATAGPPKPMRAVPPAPKLSPYDRQIRDEMERNLHR